MVTTQAFYKILEAEIIYYTPGQPVTQSHSLYPYQGNNKNTTSSLSIPRLNGTQVRNTHTTTSENYEQKRGNMFYLLLSLEPIYQSPIFPDMKGNFS